MQKHTESGWARFDKNENLAELERMITGQLQNRAASRQYEQIVKVMFPGGDCREPDGKRAT